MNAMHWIQVFLLSVCVLFVNQSLALDQPERAAALDTIKLERLTGIEGKFDAVENVFKISAPRTDLAVTVAGVNMIPALGLTSWAAFQPAGKQIMVMGDLVLAEDQVNPVLSSALENGIEVTALHNHFLWDTPKVMFMHIGGTGDLEPLASGIGKVFAKISDTRNGTRQAARAAIDAAKTSLDPRSIETVIGTPVEKAGEVYKVTIGRTTRTAGHEVGKMMGVNTWAAFAGSNEAAVVDGDFAMLESELQSVLKALHNAGILITAIHHHMIGESPKIILLHYWGTGTVSDLAKAVKAGLDAQKP